MAGAPVTAAATSASEHPGRSAGHSPSGWRDRASNQIASTTITTVPLTISEISTQKTAPSLKASSSAFRLDFLPVVSPVSPVFSVSSVTATSVISASRGRLQIIVPLKILKTNL